MTTEQELLKQIWESDGKIPLQLIAKRLGIGIDYIGYLCKELIRKGLVKKFERNRYKVTAKGRKSLVKLELITSAKKPPLRQRVAYKRKARKKVRKERKGGKKKVSKKSKKRIRKKPKRKRKSTTKKITRKIKRKIKKERKKVLESKIQPAPLSSEDEKISSIEQTPTRDSKIAEESKPITPSKKKKEPNKLLKIFKGLFGTKKE